MIDSYFGLVRILRNNSGLSRPRTGLGGRGEWWTLISYDAAPRGQFVVGGDWNPLLYQIDLHVKTVMETQGLGLFLTWCCVYTKLSHIHSILLYLVKNTCAQYSLTSLLMCRSALLDLLPGVCWLSSSKSYYIYYVIFVHGNYSKTGICGK